MRPHQRSDSKSIIRFSLFATLFCSVWAFSVEAQEQWELETVVPPDVSAFKNGIGSEVGSNGNLHIDIPLMTVPGRNGLDFPITLKYSAGIRIRQASSWVGLGWDLDLGSVSRIVQQWPDGAGILPNYAHFEWSKVDIKDYYQIAGHMLNTPMYQVANYRGPGTDVNFKLGSVDRLWKIDYSVADFAGLRNNHLGDTDDAEDWASHGITMYVDNNPHNEAATTSNDRGFRDFDRFLFTSPEGTRLVFGGGATSHNGDTLALRSELRIGDVVSEYVSNWRITSILSTDYVDGGTGISNDPLNPVDNPDTLNSGSWIAFKYTRIKDLRLRKYHNPNLLMQVTYPAEVITPSHKAVFYTSNKFDIGHLMPEPYVQDDLTLKYPTNAYQMIYRMGVSGPLDTILPQKLDSIKLFERTGGQCLQTVIFTYEPDSLSLCRGFVGDTLEGLYFGWLGKLTLKSVTFRDMHGVSQPGYTFSYHSFNPLYFTDHVAGTGAGTDRPFDFAAAIPVTNYATYMLDPNTDFFRFRQDRFGFFYALPHEVSTFCGSMAIADSLEVHATCGAVAYSLKKTTFPTGGWEVYTYENNTFDSQDKAYGSWFANTQYYYPMDNNQWGMDTLSECGIRLRSKTTFNTQLDSQKTTYRFGKGHVPSPPLSAWRYLGQDQYKNIRQFNSGNGYVEYEYIDRVNPDASFVRRTYYESGQFFYNKQKFFKAWSIKDRDITSQSGRGLVLTETNYDWKRNILRREDLFNKDSVLTQATIYEYDFRRTYQSPFALWADSAGIPVVRSDTLICGLSLLLRKREDLLDIQGVRKSTKVTEYQYAEKQNVDSLQTSLPSSIVEFIANDPTQMVKLTKLKYAKDFFREPNSFPERFYGMWDLMRDRNIMSPVFEKVVNQYCQDGTLYAEFTKWDTVKVNGTIQFKPRLFYRWDGDYFTDAYATHDWDNMYITMDSDYKLTGRILEYDRFGNIVKVQDALGTEETFEWSPTYRHCKLTKRIKNGLMRQYWYNPFYQVETIIDENNVTNRFEYDGLGRLVRVRGPRNEIVKEMRYHYQNSSD